MSFQTIFAPKTVTLTEAALVTLAAAWLTGLRCRPWAEIFIFTTPQNNP